MRKQYVCLCQGQAMCPTLRIAIYYAKPTSNKKFCFPLLRPGDMYGPGYGNTLWKSNLQENSVFACAKAKRCSEPRVWQCTVQKQSASEWSISLYQGKSLCPAQSIAMQCANTTYKKIVYFQLPRPGDAPSLVYDNALCYGNQKRSIFSSNRGPKNSVSTSGDFSIPFLCSFVAFPS